MIDASNQLREKRKITCSTVWSINNEDHKMSSKDLEVRDSILTDEKIPEDIQVLIINAASQTGINIKSPIDYVVVHSTDEDVVTQVIGRVRHDVDTVYLFEKEKIERVLITSNMLDAKWIGVKLYKKDKENSAK